jgi:hypothetical protein
MHQCDLALLDVALSARPLNRHHRDSVGGLLQHRRDEIAQPHARQEFGIERIVPHGLFVHELVVPAYLAGALVENGFDARIERRKMIGILLARSGWNTGRTKPLQAGRLVDHFIGGASCAEQPAGRGQRVRYQAFSAAAGIDRFDGLHIKITASPLTLQELRGRSSRSFRRASRNPERATQLPAISRWK